MALLKYSVAMEITCSLNISTKYSFTNNYQVDIKKVMSGFKGLFYNLLVQIKLCYRSAFQRRINNNFVSHIFVEITEKVNANTVNNKLILARTLEYSQLKINPSDTRI